MFNHHYLQDGQIELRLDRVKKRALFFPIVYQYDIYLYNSNTQVGRCDYRLLNNIENYYAGNIGYMIYQSYRGNHYSYKAALLLLKIAKDFHIKSLYITCSPENVASRKTILQLNGNFIEKTSVPKGHFLRSQGEDIKEIYLIRL